MDKKTNKYVYMNSFVGKQFLKCEKMIEFQYLQLLFEYLASPSDHKTFQTVFAP